MGISQFKKISVGVSLLVVGAVAVGGILHFMQHSQLSQVSELASNAEQPSREPAAASQSANQKTDSKPDMAVNMSAAQLAQAVSEESDAQERNLLDAHGLVAEAPRVSANPEEIAKMTEQSVALHKEMEGETEAEGEDLY